MPPDDRLVVTVRDKVADQLDDDFPVDINHTDIEVSDNARQNRR